MAMKTLAEETRPRWPSDPIDPISARVSYNPVADELVITFDERSIASYVEWIEAPESSDAAVLVAFGGGATATAPGEIVGVQIDHLLERPGIAHPTWRELARPAPVPEAVARLIADIEDLFGRYGVPVGAGGRSRG